MNAKSVFSALIAVALLSTTGAALASEATLEPLVSTTSTLTRAQVIAEAVEARRLGLLSGGEVTVLPTAAQLERIQMAGLQAVSMNVARR